MTNKNTQSGLILTLTLGLSLAMSSPALAANCPNGMVQSGPTCVDKYEASMWKITNERCIKQLQDGQEVDPRACGAIQVGIGGIDYTDAQCKFNGGGCMNIFAMSLAGVIPARSANYFVAAAACRNSGKRLLSNAD